MVDAIRVGQGFDLHALVPGRRLLLGGVSIEHERGLLGHSDADVLLHAITDALLGAAGLGDIGRLFPDSDPRYRDADSGTLLAEVAQRVRQHGWRVANLDCTVIAQQPRIAPHVEAIRDSIAALLDVEPARINVKGKTTERLGSIGRGEAIAASAVVLLTGA
jgi:2-C-methyl-D-erythritol 2,4-cyclodiphosphate synthase